MEESPTKATTVNHFPATIDELLVKLAVHLIVYVADAK
jgi:hypothetical protein